VGVASTSKKTGLHEFNHKKKFNEWQFVYDPSTDRGGLITTPYQPALQNLGGQNLNSQPGSSTGTNGTSTGSSFGNSFGNSSGNSFGNSSGSSFGQSPGGNNNSNSFGSQPSQPPPSSSPQQQ
jgi:hypothetical protein